MRSPQIELKAGDLYDKAKVDLETIVIDDVFKLLDCTEEGLTDEEATRRLGIFGPKQTRVRGIERILAGWSFVPSLLGHPAHAMRVTVSQFHVEPAFLGHGNCCPRRYHSLERWRTSPHWEDFVGIVLLLLANSAERNAEGSHGLARTQGQAEALWNSNLRIWVPGDMISFKIRDIVSADSRLTEAINVSISLSIKPNRVSFLSWLSLTSARCPSTYFSLVSHQPNPGGSPTVNGASRSVGKNHFKLTRI